MADPAPGSAEAKAMGCTCSGEVTIELWTLPSGNVRAMYPWLIRVDCPIHNPRKDDDR